MSRFLATGLRRALRKDRALTGIVVHDRDYERSNHAKHR
jgi:hypothetical protein